MITSPFSERYEPTRRLGQGGGGEVWAARDRATGELVALKVLHVLSGPREAEALIRETIALSGLEGLGFPRVLSWGRTASGQLFLVRELVDGESLEEIQNRDPYRAISILPQLADVLTVVHRTGLLHGDVKPANVIVRRQGEVALVDLGLSTALREGGNVALGLTPHYAAPEVLAGGPLTVQAEVHALGVLLRDLLELERGTRLSSALVRALGEVALRAVAVQLEDRHPSADEFGSAVRTALRGDVPPRAAGLVPWPVLGVDAWASQLRRRLEETPEGARLDLVGPPGSGRTTLARRLSWGFALEGWSVVFVDPALEGSSMGERIVSEALRPGGLVIVDAPGADRERWSSRVREARAKLVWITEQVESSWFFEVPELEQGAVRTLLRGALPGLPAHLLPEVRSLVGARPLALRRFVQAAGKSPLGSGEDIARVLSGAEGDRRDPLRFIESCLDRGHYEPIPEVLSRLSFEEPEVLWLAARHQIVAGSAAEALRLVDTALSQLTPQKLRERLRVTRARALLGVGKYEDVLGELKAIEGFELVARVEGLAYRGLAYSLLGRAREALEVQRQAERWALEEGSPRLLALVSSSLGTVEWRSGDPTSAIASYERAVEAASRAGDSGLLASSQINLAALHKERGDLAVSIELLEAAVDAASRAGRRASVQQALLNLTNLDLYLGRYERARAELLHVGEPADLPSALRAQLHGLQAELLSRTGQPKAALREYEECAQVFESLGRRRDASEARLEAALGLLSLGEAERSAEPSFSEREIERWVSSGKALLGEEITPLLCLAEALLAHLRGEPERAEALAREAEERAKEARHREWAFRALLFEAELFETASKFQKAERARAEALEILEEIGARLPPDLREVYWNDPRRRSLRDRKSGRVEPTAAAPARFTAAPVGPRSGTDVVSRLTQTPLEQRLARILAINRDLASEQDLDRLAAKILGHAAELLGAERGYLLLGQDESELEVAAHRSAQAEEHQNFSRSIAGQVLRTGEPLISVDAGRDQRILAFQSVHAALISAVACVPIYSPVGVPVGALYLESRLGARPDFKGELPTLQAFADQAAIALENARLWREVSQKGEELEAQNHRLEEAQTRLKELLGRRTQRLKEVRHALRETRDKLTSPGGFRGLVGSSPAMRRIYALIERVQETNVPVLITGESGTGKEVVARAIHEGSGRKSQRLWAINCGAVPESILESELFGHKRGAFTGADRDRRGLFQEAQGGTVFLDEIGETPLKMQAALLRVLQEQKVRPVGSSEEVAIDTRVIFATNRDLEEAVSEGKFREDLLYRIQVVEIALPPLRERREDIPLLVDHFLARFAVRFSQEKKSLSKAALARVLEHPLLGNVRQLENVLLNAWVLSDGTQMEEEDVHLPRLPSARAPTSGEVRPNARKSEPVKSARGKPKSSSSGESWSDSQKAERQRIIDALTETGWNRVRTAEVLGIPRRTLYRRLRDYGLQ